MSMPGDGVESQSVVDDVQLTSEQQEAVAAVAARLTPEQRKRVAILAAKLRASDKPVWEFEL